MGNRPVNKLFQTTAASPKVLETQRLSFLIITLWTFGKRLRPKISDSPEGFHATVSLYRRLESAVGVEVDVAARTRVRRTQHTSYLKFTQSVWL